MSKMHTDIFTENIKTRNIASMCLWNIRTTKPFHGTNLPLYVSEVVTPAFHWLSSQSFYFSQLHTVSVYCPDEYWGLRQHSPEQSWVSWLWNKGILYNSPMNQIFIHKHSSDKANGWRKGTTQILFHNPCITWLL